MPTTVLTNPTTSLTGTPLERVPSLADDIRRAGDEAQLLRRCPDWIIDTLVDQGFFRFTIPRELGGEDASIAETIEVLEAISAIDAWPPNLRARSTSTTRG
jgi:alkylation response protein AidB-like acyl-CoA dehydrogenase